jgi:MoaA/NifB/PqqE/SkfB family radical SAM enzyme
MDKIEVKLLDVDPDQFKNDWHQAASVPKYIYAISNNLQRAYTYSDFSFVSPPRAIHTDHKHVFKGLKSIEINPTELCNRTCHFCPRHDPEVYPNQNLHMTVDTAQALADDLVQNNYKGQITISGMGEPLLNRKILDIIKVFSKHNIYTEMVTNGDKILQEKWYTLEDFVDAGLSCIFVDVYDDMEQYKWWKSKLTSYKGKIRYRLTPRFVSVTSNFNNRTGMSTHEGIVNDSFDASCYAPSVKGFVDWDGTVQLCCHDWSRTGGNFGNINDQPFHEIWNNKQMNEIRYNLMTKSRLKCGAPCESCNTGGNQKDKFIKKTWLKALTLVQ